MSFRLFCRSKVIPVLWSLESVSLAGRRSPRLDDVTLDIDQGVTAVLGESGAGKTSLLNLLVEFERPSSGRIRFRGAASANRLSVFWAPPHPGLWPHLSVRDHLTNVSPQFDKQTSARADDLLAKFDLLDKAAAKPDSLSLGEQSRLNVVRALFSGAQVLVMDEPLSHVDSARSGRYWDVIRQHCTVSGTSLVFSTHAPEVVLREASQTICLTNGRVSYCGDVSELYQKPASPELATLLGPCNWLPPDERTRWCPPQREPAPSPSSDSRRGDACVRPECLEVEASTDSPLQVEASRFVGSAAEIDIRDERTGTIRQFIYRPRGMARVQRGERVILKVLLLLLIVGLSGCFEDASPTLSVRKESNWLMPPDGPRVPAPRGMTVSPNDEYLVLDNVGRVLVFDKNGDIQRQWWMPEYSVGKAEGICVLQDGRIAVADTHYHRVVLFDHQGQVTGTFGQYGSEPGDFVYPVKITQDPDQNLYVCEYGQNDRVQKFRPDGTFLLQFGGPGTEPGQFQRPSGIVWCEHELFVVDAFNNRIQVFQEDGKLIAVLADGDKVAEVHYPYDIAVDQNGDLIVVEYGGGRISKFRRDGRLLGRYGKPGSGQTTAQFSTPWGVAIDRRGRLYVCDTGNRRIVELEL